jgi:hypothetical protein
MRKIINKLIKEFIKGVDTYTHNGSTWLIFTDTKQWVIELTEDKTLWYNYNFFKGMFSIASMDVVDNQHYITQWVEDNVINKVEHTSQSLPRQCSSVDDIIENGVKETSSNVMIFQSLKVEDAIKNGVKVIKGTQLKTDWSVENAIKNGVKETHKQHWELLPIIDYTIKNGVKRTEDNPFDFKEIIENVIDNGVKETIDLEMDDEIVVGDIIENGVRVISPMTQYADWQVEEIIENGINKTKQCLQHVSEIENVIDNGVKETHSVSKNLFWEIGDTLQNGVKIKPALECHEGFKQGTPYVEKFFSKEDVENTIENGVKETRLEQNITEGEVEEIIDNGVKETFDYMETNIQEWEVDEVIKDGELKTGPRNLEQFGQGYSLWKTETVINEGVKETKTMDEWVNSPRIVGEVIDNGIIETIREGVKETKPIGGESSNYPNSIIGYVINNGVKESEKIS